MAIAQDGLTITSHNVATNALTVASNSNRLLLVSYATYQGGGPSGIMFNGVALTKIVEKVGSFNEKASIWGLLAPDVGTFNVVVSGGSDFYSVGIYSLYNVDQTLPTNFITGGGDSATASLALTTLANESWVITCIESEPDPTMTTSGGTADWEQEGQSYQHGSGQHIVKSTPGSQTMSASLSYGARWNQVNVEVKLITGISPSASMSPSASASLSQSPSASLSPSSSASSSSSASTSPSASRSPSSSASASQSPSASLSPSASASSSASQSPSSSASASRSPSASLSPSASRSPSTSTSPSSSASASTPPVGLRFRGIDIMSETKDLLDNPDSDTKINNLIDSIDRDYPRLTHIGVSVPQNTNAEAFAARGSNFAIEPAVYAKKFTDRIHADGLNVLWRGTDCYFEAGGLYTFPYQQLINGNRFTYLALPIDDNFSSVAPRNHGYGKISVAGDLSTNYLTNHQSGNTWSIAGSELVAPAANGWARTCLFNAAYLRDVTMLAKVKKVGNQQILVRASTDSNFPGYGLQMRDTNILRIERPGLASLGEVTKTWVEGSWYWMKLEATGTTIRGKAWLDGTSEPASWDISTTDVTYTKGYCGFSGESSFGHFDDMTITPAKMTNTWMARACDFVDTNINLFANGDIIAPYPEADAHQQLNQDGLYNDFMVDLKYCLDQVTANHGLSTYNGFTSQNFTGVIQGGRAGEMFTIPNMTSVDHYGTALGLNKRFSSGSAASQLSITGSDTFTVPTTLVESASTRCDFIPEKVSLNKEIDIYIVNKGTGNWTMTIHDENNNPVQLPDHTNIALKSNSYQVTIPNASLTNSAWNTFAVDWDNPDTDHTYHFHLTSTVADGTVRVLTGHSGDENYTAHEQFKYNASADAIEIDLRKLYLKTGTPIFLEEWGDYWSLDASRSAPVRDQTQHSAYLDTIYAALTRLVNDGILQGFNYWRYLGGYEAIGADADVTAGYDYQMNYAGVKLQSFFANNFFSQSASTSPSASRSPSASPSLSLSPSASRSPSASTSASLSPSASRSPSASMSPSSSASPSPVHQSPSASLSPSASASSSASGTIPTTWKKQVRHINTWNKQIRHL